MFLLGRGVGLHSMTKFRGNLCSYVYTSLQQCQRLGLGHPLDQWRMLSLNTSSFPKRKRKWIREREIWIKNLKLFYWKSYKLNEIYIYIFNQYQTQPTPHPTPSPDGTFIIDTAGQALENSKTRLSCRWGPDLGVRFQN